MSGGNVLKGIGSLRGGVPINPTGRFQGIVANGCAFTPQGIMYIADTSRGAIWKVTFNADGTVKSPMVGDVPTPQGCDETYGSDKFLFEPNTLCFSNIFVAHPILHGADGITLDQAKNLWIPSNERQAVMFVTKKGKVFEVFRNDVNDVTGLRNEGDNATEDTHILEAPSNCTLVGKQLCCANFDLLVRRDNYPLEIDGMSNTNTSNGGELVGRKRPLAHHTDDQRGKISCLDQETLIKGLPLPVLHNAKGQEWDHNDWDSDGDYSDWNNDGAHDHSDHHQ